MIEKLDWDSDFFNMKIGKVSLDEVTEDTLERVYEQKITDQFQMVYLFCKKADTHAESLISENNGRCVDIKLTYQKFLDKDYSLDYNSINQYSGPITEELISLALASGHQSRFQTDPFLKPHFDRLYTKWIRNSLDGILADVIFVHQTENQITGLITLKRNKNIGEIGLLAVDLHERGKGIGGKLLQAADNWFMENSLKSCIVVTQQVNLAACKLYESNGFVIINKEIIFHL